VTGEDEPFVLMALDDDGVLLVTLNHPERRNAWSGPMELAYYAALDRAVADPDVRAVVVTGTGGTWCPGMDMELLSAASSGGPPIMGARRPQTFTRLVPKLVVAAVDGACAGIGFIQALMCDVRFTTPAAKWTPSFAKIGLNPEDGVAWALERAVGFSRATDLLLSSRIVRGEEAARIGLATDVVAHEDLLEHALAYARTVALSCSPLSVALAKKALLEASTSSLEQSRLTAMQLLWQAKQHPDHEEGVKAFREKRPASFAGLDPSFGLLSELGPAQLPVLRGAPRP
jgi:enoyl-CoA hydratase/carnithine racemase